MHHRVLVASAVAAALLVASAPVAQSQPATQTAAYTDIYHVHFNKALPGQVRALADQLKMQDPKAPMPGHLVVLRHQDGDDWDYCVIEHLGTKATVEVSTPASAAAPPVSAWHDDTFVMGPSWTEFARAMGVGSGSTGNSVYEVAVWRAVPGHRQQLLAALNRVDPASKVPQNQVTLQHLEGGPWNVLAINRFNSWQDYATNQAATVPNTGSGSDTWSEVREHSTFHRDTLADRIAPK